jgi:hypothetical protein
VERDGGRAIPPAAAPASGEKAVTPH